MKNSKSNKELGLRLIDVHFFQLCGVYLVLLGCTSIAMIGSFLARITHYWTLGFVVVFVVYTFYFLYALFSTRRI
jgi:hypothetical protein